MLCSNLKFLQTSVDFTLFWLCSPWEVSLLMVLVEDMLSNAGAQGVGGLVWFNFIPADIWNAM